MADITDRPSQTSIQPEVAPAPPGFVYEEEPYRPLSLLALGGFVLAILFIASICVGGLIAVFVRLPLFFMLSMVLTPLLTFVICLATGMTDRTRILMAVGLACGALVSVLGFGGLLYYSSSDPWLLSNWVLVIPVSGLLLCAIGRSQIQRSERTLSGLPLCNWGMGLIVAFGLTYSAYFGATFFAVWQQSSTFAVSWLDKMHRGELDKAFRLTQLPEKRPPDNADLRSKLENLFNSGPANSAGKFGDFCMTDLTHQIQSTPSDTPVESLKLLSWKYERGEYTYRYGYRINSYLAVYDIEVVVRGQESAQDLYKGRQWFVDIVQTRLLPNSKVTTSDEAIQRTDQIPAAREFVTMWIAKWYVDDDKAYLWSLPMDKRAQAMKQAAGPGRDAFHAGDLVECEPKLCWISPSFLDTYPAALKSAFRPGGEKPFSCILHPNSSVPIVQVTDAETEYTFDLRMIYKEGQKSVKPADIEAQIVVATDNTSLRKGQPDWQVMKIKLVRVRGPVTPNPAGISQLPQPKVP